MGESLSQGVDIQLKVLQALLSLLTNYRDVHDELLGDVSRNSVCRNFTLTSESPFLVGFAPMLPTPGVQNCSRVVYRGRDSTATCHVSVR